MLSEKRQQTSPSYQNSRYRALGLGRRAASDSVRLADLMVNIPMSAVALWADSISAVIARIGLFLSAISSVFVKELDCFFYVDDNLSASLDAGVFEDGVLVVLGCDVGDAEEFFDSSDAIDILSGCCACRGWGILVQFTDE